ncbi:hypothetical protein DFR58_103179 [Anaerobacterium chartisolvens]|uniref:Uncharacterized protein n=1 Tax=Anaerobacterium chartisolvens TaxID=1297424 RepID=A0A369BD17_9FIRM|nr:hypothetical protein [Anaerobacterium chartisolvens]RCX19433.1 hypothetical protein DFR58_103179 [Anaerobacterium chartisolvens]
MQSFNPNYMQMMSMPQQYSPMTAMPDEQLENMYPKTYHIVQPMVENECNNMVSNYGDMYCPNKAHLENMIENIYKKVEANVEVNVEADMKVEADVKGAVKDDIKEKSAEKEKEKDKEKSRQFGFGGRRILRDLTGILLIRELMRRRRPFYGYPGYYGGGFGGGYGGGFGYPGYYGRGYPMY